MFRPGNPLSQVRLPIPSLSSPAFLPPRISPPSADQPAYPGTPPSGIASSASHCRSPSGCQAPHPASGDSLLSRRGTRELTQDPRPTALSRPLSPRAVPRVLARSHPCARPALCPRRPHLSAPSTLSGLGRPSSLFREPRGESGSGVRQTCRGVGQGKAGAGSYVRKHGVEPLCFVPARR